MKTTVWQKKPMVIYIGGDPTKNKAPDITIEIQNPQILIDTESSIITILETK